MHGTLDFDWEACLSSTFEGEIDATRIWTGEPDAHLRSADFLDVESHPTIAFSGRLTERTGDTHFKAETDLTIRGVTRPVVLEVSYLGQWDTEDLESTGAIEFYRSARDRLAIPGHLVGADLTQAGPARPTVATLSECG